MKAKVKNNGRDKKFIGAAIGAVANIAGGIIGNKKKKKAAKAQEAADMRNIALQADAEANQQAAAMSSSYANQDYINDLYGKVTLKNGGKVKSKDRIAIAKKYAMGGRRKKLFGMSEDTERKVSNGIKIFDNLATIGINAATNNRANMKPTQDLNTLQTASTIQKNKEIARKAEEEKLKDKVTTTPIMKAGGRKKALAGIGDAIGGISNMVSSIASKPEKPKTGPRIQGSYSYAAPKTGLKENSYQTDAEGNPLNATTNNGTMGTLDMNNPQYRDRLLTAKMGMRKRKK